MKQEEKELLLKDLCGRLPYGVYVVDVNENDELISTAYIIYDIDIRFPFPKDCSSIKPYLRPMSSMTEEEKKELSVRYVWKITSSKIQIRYHSEGYWDTDTECPTEEYLWLFDWLNSHHFDYHGLIEKGLALEAPEGMYKFI